MPSQNEQLSSVVLAIAILPIRLNQKNYCVHYLKHLYSEPLYPKSLELHGGGKWMKPHELSPLSDWGEWV